MVKRIEIRLYGDKDMLTHNDTTARIMEEIADALKKTLPYGTIDMHLVFFGRREQADLGRIPAEHGARGYEQSVKVDIAIT